MDITWTQNRLTGEPRERSSHQIAFVDGRLYATGGEHIARTPIDQKLHVVDLTAGSAWECVSTNGAAPSARIAHTQVVVGTDIWYFGGRMGIDMDEGALGDLHRYDTVAKTWSAVEASAGTAPEARSFHAMAAAPATGKLYVFGGCLPGHRRESDLHEFDITTSTWRELPTLDAEGAPWCKGRGGAAITISSSGKTLFVVGGFSGEENGDVYAYDLRRETWAKLGDDMLPRPCSVTGIATLGDHVVVFGGEVDPSEKGHEGAGAFSNDVSVFRVTDGDEGEGGAAATATPVAVAFAAPDAPRPTPRGWLGFTATGPASAVLFGGLAGDDASPLRLNDTWTLTLA